MESKSSGIRLYSTYTRRIIILKVVSNKAVAILQDGNTVEAAENSLADLVHIIACAFMDEPSILM
jgi:hypothetical protein